MIKKLMMMFAAVAGAVGAWAATETVGGYTWTYRINGDTAKIYGTYNGYPPYYTPAISPSPTGTVTIPSTLGGKPVTSIGGEAFYNCSGLTSVTIPDSVTSIGDYAFYNCSGLTSVTIPNSVTSIESYAFYGCSGLRNVSMPVSVKTLGDGVFQNCTGLESVSIPVSITAIPYNAFYGCTSLRTLDLPVTVKSIGSYAFYGCVSLSSVSIPFSVKSIGSNAFYGCSSLSNLELASGLESIGYNAFYGCNGLREVVIPASVTSVSSYAFGACGNIRRVTVPGRVLGDMSSVFGDSCKTITSLAITEGVKSIDSSSFYNCDGLTSISIPASVTRISESVFRYSCPALSEITIAPGNANYKFSGGLLLTKDGKEIVAVPRGRTWVSIPDTVTEIWRETFNNCPSLNFTWRNGVKSIDGWVLGCDEDDLPKNFTLSGYRGIANGAFSYCEALTGITIGEGVKSIGAYSFEECSNLTSISIPASVTHIDDSAFDGCYRISSINLSSGNKNYKYTGGLLVSADSTELVAASRTVTSVKIPEGVSCVRSGFFAGCAKLTGVTFPSSVEEVGDYGSMFGGWEEIEDDDDWYYKFHGCPALKTITVAPGNQYYKSVNGLLLGMDDGDLTLKAVPQSLTSVNVPEGVRWLSGDAFVGCSKLTAVTFPRSLYEYDGELYDDEYDIDESSGPYKLTSINVAAGNEEYSSVNGLLLSADGTEIYEVPRGLTSVTIPASVTYVDPEDFEYCKKLKSFSVEKDSKSFFAANGMLLTKNGKELLCVPTALKSQMTITIPADTMRIGGYAFGGFSQLTSIVIPEGVAEIGDYAFSYCTALSSVKLPQSLTKIGGDAFRDCSLTSLVLPNGLESIGARAFEGCKLSSISIPDSVTRIHADAFGSRGKSSSGTCEPSDVNNKNDVFDADSIPGLLLVDGWVVGLDSSSRIQNEQDDPTEYLNQALQDARIRGIACRAFEDCSWLRCLTLPSCVKYVGGSLFDGCSRLEWVVIPEGVEEIEGAAFSGCQNLSGVSIPDSVRTVGQNVFQGCSFIDKESIPGIEIVDGWILQDVGVSSRLSEDDSFEGTYVISGEQGIRGIADGAFAGYGHGEYAGCANTDPGLMGVTSLVVGDGVTAIGSRAFAFCDDLTNVYVAASVKYIGEEAFYDCRGLTSVQLPDTLKGKIPDSVFAKCPESLKITYYEAPRPVHVATFRDKYSKISRRTDSDGFEDWYWKTTVVVPRGRTHTFWISGLTKNTAITSLEVCCDYKYKEDGETYEDFVCASEYCEVENATDGWNMYALLTADDWEWVPSSKRSLKFTVSVYGCGGDGYSDEDLSFSFGHAGGAESFPGAEPFPGEDSCPVFEEREIEEGRAIGELPAIQRNQHKFLGWFTEGKGGEKISDKTLMGERDVAYYAHWWYYGGVFADVGQSTLDEDDNIVVTLSNDVGGTVEIPDNVGAVTIDLNGHDMVGDGGPAIRIVKGDGESGGGVAATRLAIVDTSEGEKGQILGGGESAGIEVAEDAATSVKLDVEDGVGVFNGDGSEQPWWELCPIEATLVVGEYFKATLAELGYDVPADGVTPYSVVAKGLPAGLKLKYNAAVAKKVKKGKTTKKVVVKPAKVEWWIEGVPTAAMDFFTNPPYLVITANGATTTEPLPVEVLAQNVTELEDLALGQTLNEQYYLPGVTNGWTVSGLPTGLKYTAKMLTTSKKVGKKTVVTTNALPYSVYGKTTKAGLFTITAKKKVGAYYETKKYRVLVTPKAVDAMVFGEELTNITTMAYVPVSWDLTNDVAAVGVKVSKVAGLPGGIVFAAKDTYAYSNPKKKTGKYLKQYGQTIVGTPTKPGTYVVTFTKNVTTGTGKNKKTVAKTAQILWTVTANDANLELGFNTAGGVIEGGSVGLKYGDLMAFTATDGATVTASGMPAGITLANLGGGSYAFTGFTTKAGTYLVTVKATLKGKTVTQRVALKVDALPAWAKGTFNGYIAGEDGATNGLATVTVSSVGKISGKFQEGGTNWTFTAASYTGYDDAAPAYSVPVIAKYSYKEKEKVKVNGKWTTKTVTKSVARNFTLRVGQDALGGLATLEEVDGGSTVHAWQNLWGQADYKALGKRLFSTKSGKKTLAYRTFTIKGTDDVGAEMGLTDAMSLSLKVTTAGAVTATMSFDTGKTSSKGKAVIYKPTCSTVVIPLSAADNEEFEGEVFLFFAPSSANGFPGFAGAAPF